MRVIRARAFRPKAPVTWTSSRASPAASSRVRMKPPAPHFTSKTIPAAPEATFLLKMLAVMSGTDSTVPVTSRSAYSSPSAGARSSLCPAITTPTSRTCFSNSAALRRVRNPGIASSLSSVPPVCPSPRPAIMGTAAPHAAIQGASAIETLSPTPPVECLSTAGRPSPVQSRMRPDRIMASVRTTVSSRVIPRNTIAMRRAALW